MFQSIELYAKKIRTDFENEKKELNKKFENSGYPRRFVQSAIRDFDKKQSRPAQARDESEEKTSVPLGIPFCEKNEKLAKHFIKKLKAFTGNQFRFSIIWQSKK